MGNEARLKALVARHSSLDDELEVEQKRPLPDDETITQLKRQKLDLKDEIGKLQAAS